MAQPLVAPDRASAPAPVHRTAAPDCERLDAYRVAVEFQLLAAVERLELDRDPEAIEAFAIKERRVGIAARIRDRDRLGHFEPP